MPKFMLLLATQKGLAVLLSIVRSERLDIVGFVLTFEERYSIDYEKNIKKVCLESLGNQAMFDSVRCKLG